MVRSSPVFPLANDEMAYLKSIKAFMLRRLKVEEQTLSGLWALLKNAPTLPERKWSWHCALEKLLEGTRHDLAIRVEELKALTSAMEAVATSIANAEACINTLSLEFATLALTGRRISFRSARETATLHRDIESAGVGLFNLLSLSSTQRENMKQEALEKYRKQDLVYRREIHEHQESQKQFLNLIPRRIQEYGTKYQTVVSDLSTLMGSLSNYLQNVSSTCNSSGSTLWAACKDIKPLVDANCHVEVAQSCIQFPPITYCSPWPESTHPEGQTILFGCPLELCTDGKLPPVLEYLFDSFPSNEHPQIFYDFSESWTLVNKVERAWTGVETSDRAFLSKYDLPSHHRLLIAYFNSLPEPIFSPQDIVEAKDKTYLRLRKIWDSWSQDPVKAAVLQAVLSCESRVIYLSFFSDMAAALSQGDPAAPRLSGFLNSLARYPEIWQPCISGVSEETR